FQGYRRRQRQPPQLVDLNRVVYDAVYALGRDPSEPFRVRPVEGPAAAPPSGVDPPPPPSLSLPPLSPVSSVPPPPGGGAGRAARGRGGIPPPPPAPPRSGGVQGGTSVGAAEDPAPDGVAALLLLAPDLPRVLASRFDLKQLCTFLVRNAAAA